MNTKVRECYSDSLFARPSFVEGLSRLADLGSTLNEYNTSPSNEIADARALAADWQAVGFDIRRAMLEALEAFKDELPPHVYEALLKARRA
jgi:hypothetical protein